MRKVSVQCPLTYTRVWWAPFSRRCYGYVHLPDVVLVSYDVQRGHEDGGRQQAICHCRSGHHPSNADHEFERPLLLQQSAARLRGG